MVTLELQKNLGRQSTDSFDIVADAKVVGFCQLRHVPSRSGDMPENFENHIYYEITPEERGKGYAKEALHLMIEKAKQARWKELIVVMREDNIPSRGVAEANGAKLIEEQKGSNGITYAKFSVKLK